MPQPTESELEILHVLWREGPQTVRQVNEALNAHRKVGYTTTLKTMQIMTEKGLLSRDESARSHRYAALVAQEEAQGQMLDRLLKTAFGGSASRLVMRLLGKEKQSPEELRRIREMLDAMERDEAGKQDDHAKGKGGQE